MGRFDDSFYTINNVYADLFEQSSVKLPTDEDIAKSEAVIEELTNIMKNFKPDEEEYSTTIEAYKRKLESVPKCIVRPYITEALNSLANIGCGQFNNELLELSNNITYKTYNFPIAAAFVHSSLQMTPVFLHNPKYIAISQPFSNLTKISLCHEFAHALKDKAYEEFCLRFTKVEVIPKALDFIITFKNGNIPDFENLVKNRILGLYCTSVKHYLAYKDELTSGTCSEDEKRALKYCLNREICYLNSFYYSLILFRLYLDEPEYIIELINMVLGCQITTEDMFDYLDKNKFENYASDGLAEIKKYLK